MKKLLKNLLTLFRKTTMDMRTPVTPQEAVREWFKNPVGMGERGICLALSLYVTHRTGAGKEVEIHIAREFLTTYYKRFSGNVVFPVASPCHGSPVAAFSSTTKFLSGKYGKNRKALFRVLKKHAPTFEKEGCRMRVVWSTE